MLDFGPTKKNEIKSSLIGELVDRAHQAHNKQQTQREYLGGSRLGIECKRALYYEFKKAPKDEGRDFSANILRVFDMGHDGEDRAADYLRRAGFELLTENNEGEQFEVSDADGLIKGHTDGVIVGGPENVLPYPVLWENKTAKNSKFNEMKKHGCKKANRVYYVQQQVYMAYLNLENSLFTMVNRDTGEVYYEVVPLVVKDAQDAIDKGLKIVTANNAEELPRAAANPTMFVCKWCDYHSTCWKEPDSTTLKPTEEPKWL